MTAMRPFRRARAAKTGRRANHRSRKRSAARSSARACRSTAISLRMSSGVSGMSVESLDPALHLFDCPVAARSSAVLLKSGHVSIVAGRGVRSREVARSVVSSRFVGIRTTRAWDRGSPGSVRSVEPEDLNSLAISSLALADLSRGPGRPAFVPVPCPRQVPLATAVGVHYVDFGVCRVLAGQGMAVAADDEFQP